MGGAGMNEVEELKQKLLKKYNLERDEKFEKCFHLAWEYGHSSGLSEVEIYFNDLVELIL